MKIIKKYRKYKGDFDEKSNEILNELNNINFENYGIFKTR